MEKKKAKATGKKDSIPANTPTERNTVQKVTDTATDAPDVLKEQRLQKLLKNYAYHREFRCKKELESQVFPGYHCEVSNITSVLSEIIDSINNYGKWMSRMQIAFMGKNTSHEEKLMLYDMSSLFFEIAEKKDTLLRLSEEYIAIEELLREAMEKEWEIVKI